jgi:hypothetical protein
MPLDIPSHIWEHKMKFQEFAIPRELNGEQLKAELGCDEVYIRDNVLVIGGNLTQAQALAGIAAHKPIIPPDNSTAKAALLVKLGITADEAKLLLS